jgi:hypothetical protein
MAFWALAGASALGGLASYFAGNEAADAASDAARENNQTQLQMFNRSVELNEPWRQSGISALNQQNALLGLSGVSGASGGSGPIGANNFAGYVSGNEDLANAFATLSTSDQRGIASLGYDRDGDGAISDAEYGAFHYATHGQGEGRTMPTYTQPTATETAQASSDAYADFENSGFARSMLETTQADFNNITDAAGAGGNVLSGNYLEAMNDANRANTSTAFNNYYNALGGMSGTGAQLSQSQGQQGMQYANAFSANNNQAANAQGSSYMNAANAFGSTLQNGANMYMYGSNNGWFG